MPASAFPAAPPLPLDLLRCPRTQQPLARDGEFLVTPDGQQRYRVSPEGIPLFAESFLGEAAQKQQAHYDRIAAIYVENLGYPHTQEYMQMLDRALLDRIEPNDLGTVAEICCGSGEAFHLLGDQVKRGIGVDVSLNMLRGARKELPSSKLSFIQGDATQLPLGDNTIDSVFMLGGIHHVQDRPRLFQEVARILKPGGRFYYREPVSDFFLWRWIRAVIYRVSPTLDHETERPLLFDETVPVLEQAGLKSTHWSTHGFAGFCVFMNSDVLVFNRLFRFLPGIREITRLAAELDEKTTSMPGLQNAGLQVVGVAEKPRA
jgi:ubiquinone/menaquinone biosynthesis C-methylase UbiE